MPYIIAEKSAELKPEASQPGAALALESFAATIFNLTDANFRLMTSSVCGTWDNAPDFLLARNDGTIMSSSGSFSNAACGGCAYQYLGSAVPNNPVFTISYVVPSLGPNHIVWHADPGLQIQEEGNTTGFHPFLKFSITLG
jgi:hypothetical protein